MKILPLINIKVKFKKEKTITKIPTQPKYTKERNEIALGVKALPINENRLNSSKTTSKESTLVTKLLSRKIKFKSKDLIAV